MEAESHLRPASLVVPDDPLPPFEQVVKEHQYVSLANALALLCWQQAER